MVIERLADRERGRERKRESSGEDKGVMRSILVNESERNRVSVVFKRWRERGRER